LDGPRGTNYQSCLDKKVEPKIKPNNEPKAEKCKATQQEKEMRTDT
jgi:hypothetical protein